LNIGALQNSHGTEKAVSKAALHDARHDANKHSSNFGIGKDLRIHVVS
jgi:hypothetical protein